MCTRKTHNLDVLIRSLLILFIAYYHKIIRKVIESNMKHQLGAMIVNML